jgi:hypothetical protein
MLGARHQLPDVVSMKGRLTRNHPTAPDANINAHVSNCTCLHHHHQNPACLSDNDDSPKQ